MRKYQLIVVFLILSHMTFGQIIEVSNIVRTGNFNCGEVPTITAEIIDGDGIEIIGGALAVIDPCGFTTLKVTMTGLRYNQPGHNWAHGFFFPEGENITVTEVNLPAGWIYQESCTGASCSAQDTGGQGFYYDGIASSSCCNASMNDGIPNNNWGQSTMNCDNPFSISFEMTFCNSKIETEETSFTLSGSSDGNTGCWIIADISTNQITFSINTVSSETPLYSSIPYSPETITECFDGGAELNYIAVLDGACGTGDDVTWWDEPEGGNLIGVGSPFYYDTPGEECPFGTIVYASCCPDGEGCERRPVVIGHCSPPFGIPIFDEIPPQCPGMDNPLPSVSLNDATGIWTPEFDPFNTETYTFTPDPGQCITQSIEVTVEILPHIDLTFDPMAEICQGDDPPDLPQPNEAGITGSWTPSTIDTSTVGIQTYTFTPDEGQCAEEFELKIEVTDNVLPIFDLEEQYCLDSEPEELPEESNNGIAGVWSPSTIDTSIVGTQTYIFTPDEEQCSDIFELEIEINEPLIPVFDIQEQYCQNEEPDLLSVISVNGITGTWLPEIIDTSSPGTLIYFFTPNEEECAIPFEIEITVLETLIAEFNLQTVYCVDSEPEELSTISHNGIPGNWSPSAIDTSVIGITTYIFTPDGECGEEYLLEIEVTDSIIPTFDLQQQYCLDSEPETLPTTSNNGIIGSWSPSEIDTSTVGTQTYTFTPDEEECAEIYTISIEITEPQTPVFNLQEQYCQGEEADVLFTESDNGILGTWFPEFIDTGTLGTTTYTFTPDADECAVPFEIEITVLETLIAEFNLQTVYCVDSDPEELPTISDNGIPGNWSPSAIDTSVIGITTYIFTPDGECGEEYLLEVEVTDSIIPIFDLQQQYCLDSEPETLPTTSNNGIIGSWSPSTVDTSTVGTQIYTFTPDEDQCAEIYQIEIEIAEIVEPVFAGLPESYCLNSEAESLPAVSDNGITGSWFPSEINTGIQGTSVYLFIPDETQCSEEHTLEITVYPHPEMELEEDIVICSGDSYTYVAPEGFDHYTWTDSFGNILSETPEITFTEEGIYTLTVEINGIPCELSRSIEVSFSSEPIITEIKATENTLTVYVSGNGPFEYSLDNIFWQDSNVFYNLEPGIYFVYVRDRKGCGTAAKQGAIMGVPNFISPNGDGKNDTWQIRVLEAFPNTRLQIFDRSGKMYVDRILDGDFEWDGKYNREPLPSGTYWYILTLEDGEKLSGHINLRNY